VSTLSSERLHLGEAAAAKQDVGRDARMHQALWGQHRFNRALVPPGNPKVTAATAASFTGQNTCQAVQTITWEGRADPAALVPPVCISCPRSRAPAGARPFRALF